jgi:hypothetical protein
MNSKHIKPDTLTEGKTESTPEFEQLQAQMRDMQLEIDILKETFLVLMYLTRFQDSNEL